jgi:hypothetical protein
MACVRGWIFELGYSFSRKKILYLVEVIGLITLKQDYAIRESLGNKK